MQRKLKVAFLVCTFPAITESWLLEQIISLIDLGLQVSVFSLMRNDDYHISDKILRYELIRDTTHLSLPKDRFSKLISAAVRFGTVVCLRPQLFTRIFNYEKCREHMCRLKDLFFVAPLLGKIDKYDIVHCHHGVAGIAYLAIRDILDLRQPFVTSFYGVDVSQVVKEKGLGYYDRLREESSYCLPNNRKMRDDLVRMGFDRDKTLVINNGINVSNYDFDNKTQDRGDLFRIVFVGRFVEKKGIEDLLRAISIVYRRHRNLELNIIGDGVREYKDKLVLLSRRLGIESITKFRGLLPHKVVLDLFKEMHLMVLLSRTAKNGDSEGLPYVLLEAQACGLPVISTNHAGIPEAIEDGKSGFLVEEGDYERAAKKMMYFVESPDKVREFGIEARDFAVRKFGMNKINSKLLHIYEALVVR